MNAYKVVIVGINVEFAGTSIVPAMNAPQAIQDCYFQLEPPLRARVDTINCCLVGENVNIKQLQAKGNIITPPDFKGKVG